MDMDLFRKIGHYYNKEGGLISKRRWKELAAQQSYSRIAVTYTRQEYIVSTVWLGEALGNCEGAPLIFETVVMPKHSFNCAERKFYTTEHDAIQGHRELTYKWDRHE